MESMAGLGVKFSSIRMGRLKKCEHEIEKTAAEAMERQQQQRLRQRKHGKVMFPNL